MRRHALLPTQARLSVIPAKPVLAAAFNNSLMREAEGCRHPEALARRDPGFLSPRGGDPLWEDIPEYPVNALREAITNAVMHRDWFMEGANAFVELYADRIEGRSGT